LARGTTPRAPCGTGRPATSATAAFPANPRRCSTGEYSIITPSAPSPTSSAVPLTSAAAPSPTSVPPTTHRSAVPRARRPAASGRPEGPRFTRSAAASQISFTAFPGAANPPAATAAHDHLVHPADRRQIPRLAVHHHLREAALAGRHDGDSARHRLERRQPERLALRRQQEQIPTLQQLGDPVDLAEEAHVGTQLQP